MWSKVDFSFIGICIQDKGTKKTTYNIGYEDTRGLTKRVLGVLGTGDIVG